MTVAVGAVRAELEAGAASFERDMRKAERALNTSGAKMNRALAKVERGFNKVERSVRSVGRRMFNVRTVVGTLAGSAGLGLLLKNSLDTADSIAKTADATGVATDTLQEYRFAANLAAVEQASLDSGLKAFTKRLGEARAGTGTLVEFLKKYDTGLLRAIEATDSTEEALQLLFDRMASFENQADRAALSAAAFGRTAGVDMTNLVRDGAAALAEARQEAHDLGAVLGEDTLRQAERAKDELFKVGEVMRTRFTAAMLGALPLIQSVADKIGLIAERGGAVIQFLANIENVTVLEEALRRRQSALDDVAAAQDRLVKAVKDEATAHGVARGAAATRVAAAREDLVNELNTLKEVQAQVTKLQQAIAAPEVVPQSDGGGPTIGGPRNFPKVTVKGAGELEARLKATRASIGKTKESIASLPDAARELEQVAESVKRFIESPFEAGERQIMAAERAMREGLLDPAAFAEFERQVRAGVIETMDSGVTPAINRAADAGAQFGRTVATEMQGAAIQVESLNDAVRSLLNSLANLAFNQLAVPAAESLGSSLFSGLFSGLFSTGGGADISSAAKIRAFAAGTSFAPGGPALVGEQGPELVNLPRGSEVISADVTRRLLNGGAGAGMTIVQNNDFRGADPSIVGALEARLARLKQETVAAAVAMVERNALKGGRFAKSIGKRRG